MPLKRLPVISPQGDSEPDPLNIATDGEWMEMDFPDHLPSDCYIVRIPRVQGGEGCLVFSGSGIESDAPDKIFCIGFQNRPFEVCKVLRNETPDADGPVNDPAGATRTRRKSFMTPTPLHIPTSRVSPIPGATHESLLIKPLIGGQARMIAAREVLWMHPLVHCQPDDLKDGFNNL